MMVSNTAALSISLLSLHCLVSPTPSLVAGFAYSPSSVAQRSSLRSNQYERHSSCRRCQFRSNRLGVGLRAATGDIVSTNNSERSECRWEVYVSQQPTITYKSKEKGNMPTSSIMQSFISLTPSPKDIISVSPVEFTSKQNKQKGKAKGPTVRCIQRSVAGGLNNSEILSALEITNVDSVDKVNRIMTKHMKLENINDKALECMKYYVKGNTNLEENELSKAIELYDRSLAAIKDCRPSQAADQLPKGLILMKRARAYLQRAAQHRKILRTLVTDLTDTVPSASTTKILYQTTATHPSLSPKIFDRLTSDSKVQQLKFRQIRYRHDMYEFALLHSVQDSLQATQLLPNNSKSWLLAGECLAELRKLKESNQYYARALEIDPSMEETLQSVMEKNKVSQEFIEAARANGFGGDTLRLALDVAA